MVSSAEITKWQVMYFFWMIFIQNDTKVVSLNLQGLWTQILYNFAREIVAQDLAVRDILNPSRDAEPLEETLGPTLIYGIKWDFLIYYEILRNFIFKFQFKEIVYK